MRRSSSNTLPSLKFGLLAVCWTAGSGGACARLGDATRTEAKDTARANITIRLSDCLTALCSGAIVMKSILVTQIKGGRNISLVGSQANRQSYHHTSAGKGLRGPGFRAMLGVESG